MPFAYYKRLSAKQRRIYDESDAVVRIQLPGAEKMQARVAALARALRKSDRKATEQASRQLTEAILKALGVAGVRVRVLAARPSHDWGELHGLYEPEEGRKPLLTVWMRTAQRRQVVAFKTFMRTLLHEIMHHLDYELFELDDSYHTEGFYKRESSLFRQLVPDPSLYEEGTTPRATRRSAATSEGRTRRKAGAKRAARKTAAAEQQHLPFGDS
ncbi:MAG: hypothetical protein JSW67_07755 [Candidatus Latescibacterota bacterium]|nr:MAG: hypothetical protein JSW67_07755 [Candidatus Latescibacterota bacterium]